MADSQAGSTAYRDGDFARALKALQPLAESGQAVAQHTLGIMYANGEGVSRDEVEAMRWHRLAAEQGLAAAQLALAEMHYQRGSRGEPVPQRACTSACNSGFDRCSRSSSSTGACLISVVQCARACPLEKRVVGVPDDYLKAFAWIDLAAAQGHPAATRRRRFYLLLLRFEGRHHQALEFRREFEQRIAARRAR